MQTTLLAWRIFARRGMANWRMLSVLALGVLVTSVLLASAPIYTRAMSDLGLSFSIAQDIEGRSGVRAEVPGVPIAAVGGPELRSAIDARVAERTSWFERETVIRAVAGRFFVARPGEAPQETAPFIQPQSLTGYESHVRVLEGQLPRDTGPSEPLEFALPRPSAEAAGLKVGDRIDLVEDSDTCEREVPPPDVMAPPVPCDPAASLAVAFPAVLTAIVEPAEPDAAFWDAYSSPYFDLVHLMPGEGPVLLAFTTPRSIQENIGGRFPAYSANFTWRVFVDSATLDDDTFQRASADLRGLEQDIASVGGFVYSPLFPTFERYDRESRHREAPLTILLLEIAGVSLFYVVLMSSLVVERHAEEITLLRSRGATTPQVIMVHLFEGLAIGLPIVLVSPFIAAAATSLLGLTPIFRDVSGGEQIPVSITPSAFALAAAGVLLSLLALVLPAWAMARRSAVAQRRMEARPRPSIIQRYYLDLALAAVAALLLWELRERGSVFQPSSTGGVSSDPLLLASPALFIAAAAALLLRFYPMALKLASRFGAGAGVTLAIGLWQVARSPGQYTRLALLLMMAIAVGTFAASYSRTAERSYEDRAYFASGVAWRATGAEGVLGTWGSEVDAALMDVPGVESASAVLRGSAVPATTGQSARSIQVLAVQPAVAESSLWFREDLADHPLDELLEGISMALPLSGRPLPGNPATVTIWANSTQIKEQTTLWARIRGSDGVHALVDLGVLGEPGWRQRTGSVDAAYGGDLVPPLTLVSIVLTEPSNRAGANTGGLLLDDLVVTDASGSATLIEDFEGRLPWAARPSRGSLQDTFSLTTEGPHAGRSAAKLDFTGSATGGLRGIYPADQFIPLPVIASESFAAGLGVPIGGTTSLEVGDIVVPVILRDTYRAFPTIASNQGPSVIFARDNLYAWLNAWPSSSIPEMNEGWFTLTPGAEERLVTRALTASRYRLTEITDRADLLATLEQDPLVTSGGSGILFLSFVALLVLVGVALLATLWSAVQRRRTEFGVMRALGVSRWQVLRLLALEYALVGVAGFIAGGYLGRLVGSRMLSFLEVNEDGQRVEPAFVLETGWSAVLIGGGVLVGVFCVALVIAMRVLTSSSDAQALRTE